MNVKEDWKFLRQGLLGVFVLVALVPIVLIVNAVSKNPAPLSPRGYKLWGKT